MTDPTMSETGTAPTLAEPESGTERWRPVVGWEGLYSVSSHGRVKSHARTVRHPGKGTQTVAERILTPFGGDARGYPVVRLFRDGTSQKRSVRGLVLEAFVGPYLEGLPKAVRQLVMTHERNPHE